MIDKNPYESPKTHGADLSRLQARGRTVLFLLLAAMNGGVLLVLGSLTLTGRMRPLGLVGGMVFIGGLTLWYARGSRVAKWILVTLLLLQLPLAAITLLTRPSDAGWIFALLLESAVRIALAATLIVSKSLNAYLTHLRHPGSPNGAL